MKLSVSLLTAVAFTAAIFAQDRLTPEVGVLAEENDYHAKIRELFAETFHYDSILQVVFLPAFSPEVIVGIRKTSDGFEAFASKPSYHIAERIGQYEILKQTQLKDEAAARDPDRAELERELPPDFRDLRVHTDTRAISAPLTERIRRVWQHMLLDARYPKDPVVGTDGIDVHFSMWVYAHGVVSGKVWSPRLGKTVALVDLADALGAYAEGKGDEKKVAQFVKPLER